MSKPVLSDIFAFSGRRNRLSYFLYNVFLIVLLLSIVTVSVAILGVNISAINFFAAEGIDDHIYRSAIFIVGAALLSLILWVSSLAVGAQRCRDCDWPGWIILLQMIPYVGWLLPIVLLFVPGVSGANKYGADPLESRTSGMSSAYKRTDGSVEKESAERLARVDYSRESNSDDFPSDTNIGKHPDAIYGNETTARASRRTGVVAGVLVAAIVVAGLAYFAYPYVRDKNNSAIGAQEFTFKTDRALVEEHVRFANGVELQISEGNDYGKTVVFKQGGKVVETTVEIADDFVHLLHYYPNDHDAEAVVIGTSCGGNACDWDDMYIAYIKEGKLRVSEVGRHIESIKGWRDKGGFVRFEATKMSSAATNELGDPIRRRLVLDPELGFLELGFMEKFRPFLRGAHPKELLSDNEARKAIIGKVDEKWFRMLREKMNGQGNIELFEHRYLLLSACKIHSCSSAEGAVVLDGVTDEAWYLLVDHDKKEWYLRTPKPMNDIVRFIIEKEIEFDSRLYKKIAIE